MPTFANRWNGVGRNEIEGGPNSGYWWISSISFDMFREGNLNPSAKPDATRTHPIPNASNKCISNLGIQTGQPIVANFYDYNDKCVKGKAYAEEMLEGWWGHEGFGVEGKVGATGHESLGQAEAALPNNDPWIGVDTLVRQSELELGNRVLSVLQLMEARIKNAAADPNPGGNWEGRFWFYRQSTGAWEQDSLRSY